MNPAVTIIVPCRNEEQYIARCLDSILATSWPHESLEVLVVDGMSDDNTRAIAATYATGHDCVRVLDNPRQTAPAALNIGLAHAAGDVIIRMDAHVVYPKDYVRRLVQALMRSGADNVGGTLVTVPGGDGIVAAAIARAMAHPLGVGNSYFRIGCKEPRWVDTVPFGCYRRDVFARIGLFDEDMVRNQDDEFNHRLIRQGGRILLEPGVTADYYARTSFAQLRRMFYQYGYYKPLVGRKTGGAKTLRQFAPATLIVVMAVLALAALVWPPAASVLAIVAGTYAVTLLVCAALASTGRGLRHAAVLAGAFATIHGSYGWGFLRGLGALRPSTSRLREPVTAPLSR